jgi:hypothetical protein
MCLIFYLFVIVLFVETFFQVPTRDPWMAERLYHQSLTIWKTEKDKFTAEMGSLFEVAVILILV